MIYIASQKLSHLTNDGMNRAKYMYFQQVLVAGEKMHAVGLQVSSSSSMCSLHTWVIKDEGRCQSTGVTVKLGKADGCCCCF